MVVLTLKKSGLWTVILVCTHVRGRSFLLWPAMDCFIYGIFSNSYLRVIRFWWEHWTIHGAKRPHSPGTTVQLSRVCSVSELTGCHAGFPSGGHYAKSKRYPIPTFLFCYWAEGCGSLESRLYIGSLLLCWSSGWSWTDCLNDMTYINQWMRIICKIFGGMHF